MTFLVNSLLVRIHKLKTHKKNSLVRNNEISNTLCSSIYAIFTHQQPFINAFFPRKHICELQIPFTQLPSAKSLFHYIKLYFGFIESFTFNDFVTVSTLHSTLHNVMYECVGTTLFFILMRHLGTRYWLKTKIPSAIF